MNGWIGQEYDNEDPNQYQGVVAFLLHRPIEPIGEVLHPSRRFKRRGSLKDHTQALAIGSKGLDVVRHLFVMAAMILVLGTVLEQHTVQLLDVIFGRGDGLVTLENHVHCVGITCHFLLVAAGKGLCL